MPLAITVAAKRWHTIREIRRNVFNVIRVVVNTLGQKNAACDAYAAPKNVAMFVEKASSYRCPFLLAFTNYLLGARLELVSQ
eukprot:1926252-Amphidinium_carterae.1